MEITQEQISLIRKYYQNCELFLIYNPNWRFYTFKLFNGAVKRFHIDNTESLRRLLIKYYPLVAYHSQGQWLNVQNVRGRRSKCYRIKIQEDLIFDIDNNDMEKARLSAIEIINRLDNPDYIIMTRRGFHICYYKITNKKEMINKVRDIEGLDIKCSENEFGVFSIPLTINKAGRVNVFLTKEQLNNSINELQALQPQIYIPCDSKETSERQKPMKQSSQKIYSSSRSEVNKEGTGTEGTVLLSFNNKVKRDIFIPILIYDKKIKGLKEEIDKLNLLYNLGDMYAFESDKYYAFISIRCFEKRQMEKLLNNSNSLTKNQFKKFSKIWFDISEYQLMGRLKFKINKYFRASRKHYNYFIDCGIRPTIVNELVGNPKLEIYEVHKK